jgi:hypothetical protein
MGLKGQGLLRAAIQGILREGEGAGAPGKSMELIRKLEALNANLAAAGIPLVSGVKISASGAGAQITFAVQVVDEQGPSVWDLSDDTNMDSDVIRISPESAWADALRANSKLAMRIPYGSIDVGPASPNMGPCNGSWMVHFTSPTTKGWGPLLYDLAMEAAGATGVGLMSGRELVSPSARAVWRKYDTVRAGNDVERVQLDVDLERSPRRSDVDYGEQITPDDPTDDCVQQSAADDDDVEGEPPSRNYRLSLPGSSRRRAERGVSVGSWRRSPLSRAYRKTDGGVTAELDRLNLLWR